MDSHELSIYNKYFPIWEKYLKDATLRLSQEQSKEIHKLYIKITNDKTLKPNGCKGCNSRMFKIAMKYLEGLKNHEENKKSFNLDSLNYKQLRDKAKEQGITIGTNPSKSALIEMIKNA